MSEGRFEAFRERVLDLIFPRRLACASCGREAAVDGHCLCEDCADGLELFVAAPILKNVSGYTAPLIYNDVSARMVKRLKYNGRRYLAPVIAEFIELPESWEIDRVVPVPLYASRQRKRGFNQSELIARELCKRYGLEMDTKLLKRVADTGQLVGLPGAARKRSLKGAFLADEACRGLNVLLVDDVRTTGATLTECAAELKRVGCGNVYAATFCFTKD